MSIKNLYLPKISEDANLSYPDSPGVWHETSGKVLAQLSDAISITKSELKTVVSSIPDVWAKPILFWSALYDDKHPLHKKLYTEWKGLLSLIALSKIKRYPLRFAYVNLGNDDFSDALKKLKPKPITLQKDVNYDWEFIVLIYYDEIPIGALSPATLVYTASQYNQKLKSRSIALKDEFGFLKPPDSEEELIHVGIWIQSLYIKLSKVLSIATTNKDRFIATKILQLLDDWLKDIKKSVGINEDNPIEMPDDVEIPQSIEEVYPDLDPQFLEKLKTYTAYSLVLTPMTLKEISDVKSDILLKFDKRVEVNKVLVIHEQALKDKNTRIWGKIKLEDLGGDLSEILKLFDNPEGYGKSIHGVDLENAIWIKPETYFLTDTLLKSSNGKFLNDTEQEMNSPFYVYPLKKEILQFYSHDEIVKLLSPKFETKSPDTIVFSIELTIQNSENKLSKIKVSKTYKTKPSQNEGKILNYDPPALEIFPDYIPNWKDYYYLFQNRIDLLDFEPAEIGENDPESTIYKEENIKITRMKTFPFALEVKSTEKGEPLGLILLKTPHERESVNKYERFVGVDLGTSNTNIYIWNEQSDAPSKFILNLDNYIRKVTSYNEKIREDILKEFFVPPKQISFPVPTLLRIIDPLKEKKFFLNAFIYFQDSYKTPENVRSGFKWEAEDATDLELYIKSLLFLILIDSVKNDYNKITLGVTYPKSFSESMKLQYRNLWKKICAEFSSVGVELKFVDESRNMVNMYTEGYASGQFFANEELMARARIPRAYIQESAICLDVGGGTTDIAIWYHEEICLDASLLLAGNNLINAFRRNKKLREILFSDNACKELESVLNQPTAFASKLNAILKLEEHEIKNKLLTYARNPEINWLRRFIALQFGAVAFYTGMLLAYAEKNIQNAKGIIDTFKDRVSIHWGGNGAKFLNWITFGEFDKDGIAVKFLNAIFYNSISLEIPDFEISENIEQFQSPAPKDEASGGTAVILKEIITQSKAHRELELGHNSLILGEDIVLNTGVELHALELINPDTLFDKNTRKTRFKETKLNKLTKFIELYNTFGVKFGLFSRSDEIKIDSNMVSLLKTEIFSSFVNLERITEENKRIIEPVFIMEVKSLMKNLIT